MALNSQRSRIDWDGAGNGSQIARVLNARSSWKRIIVPATVGMFGLALVGALVSGPVLRHAATALQTSERTETAAVADEAPVAQPEVFEDFRRTEPAAVATAAGLPLDDRRWNADSLAIDEDKLGDLRAAMRETEIAAELASVMGHGPDDSILTGGVPATIAGFAPDRPAAPGAASAFDAALVDDEAQEAEETGLSPARVTAYVNMRAEPSDTGSVLTVVPTNAAVEAEADCRWCKVTYDGQTGYIFQSFIAR